MAEVAENTIVDGRYRILSKIGSGGMADVYCAEDTHLGRQVALKVLYRRFAQDQEFVERFRREAKSAAGLQHPNVVNVFDRGEHDGTYYIAMEHLRGQTLKQIVNEAGQLAELRAIDVAIQILRAAGFAHRRGVIHRDFKPHNVMVGDEGVKVTDFGIARAGASEITETGSIMGTAQYLSPEQAQGQGVSSQSDLYSIAVILYEMLAGRVPFDGDSAVSVALRHLNDPPPAISSLRPGVHPALEAVVMRGLAKDPAHRYADAEEFIAALEEVHGRIAAGDREPGPEDTMVYPPLVATPSGYEEPRYSEPHGRRRWPVTTIVILTLLALAGLAALAITSFEDSVTVPDVVGQSILQATAKLEAEGFDVEERRVRDVAPEDEVIRQDPTGGEKADEGSTVTLFVSAGPGQVRIPSVSGLPERRAVRELNNAGFKVTVDEKPSDEVEEGLAIETVPDEGELLERGARVRLFVSSGPKQVEVPDVRGLSRSSAESRLEAAGLVPVVDERESSAEEDTVIAQAPAGGTEVDEGSRVTITVSTGVEEVAVPNVVGQTLRGAGATLRDAGFSVEVREQPVESESEDGIVIDQRPDAGSDRRRGRTVVIFVGRFTEQTPKEEPAPAPPAGTGAPP